jgi:hypothetical protein
MQIPHKRMNSSHSLNKLILMAKCYISLIEKVICRIIAVVKVQEE